MFVALALWIRSKKMKTKRNNMTTFIHYCKYIVFTESSNDIVHHLVLIKMSHRCTNLQNVMSTFPDVTVKHDKDNY